MAFKKIYIPVDAALQREDFDIWYEDDTLFCNVQSDWADEKSKVNFISTHGTEMARIKPDNKALNYDIRVERYTYTLHTYLIFRHYYCEGMLWQMNGSPSKGHANFTNENTNKKDVLISTVDFKRHGKCYEVKVKDISKLRIAAVVVVAILVKEAYKGLSEGERDDDAKWHQKLKQYFAEKGLTYEEVEAGNTKPY
ncbi:MAG: hypothetical protein ACOYIK_07645 [Coriobacteriales bacterium]|jgi:hypothetical protein